MKKFVLIIAALLFLGQYSYAQKTAYVDTEYVLEKMPSYQEVEEQIDRLVSGWRQEIEARYKKIDDMYRAFQAEQVLMSEAQRAKREEEIITQERETRSFQKEKFGPEGELFQRKQNLVGPIQEEVYTTVEKIATEKRIDLILDKSSGVSIIYANPKFDITNDVLKELGISSRK